MAARLRREGVQQIAGRHQIALLVNHMLVVVLSLGFGGADEQRRVTPHLNLARELVSRNPAHIGYRRARHFEIGRKDKIHVGMLGGKAPTRRAHTRAHHRRAGALQRLRFGVAPRPVEIGARKIELAVAGPEFMNEAHPLVGHRIAFGVGKLGFAKHGHLVTVPASDHVQPKASARDMVDSRRLFGGEDRMNRSHGGGRKHVNTLRGLRQSGGPGPGLEAAMIELAGAAKSFPPAHRNERFQPHSVGRLRDVERFAPVHFNAAGGG